MTMKFVFLGFDICSSGFFNQLSSAKMLIFFFFFITSQSARETKAAAHVLQTIWTYKDLRTTLNKAGWTKSHFKVRHVPGLPASPASPAIKNYARGKTNHVPSKYGKYDFSSTLEQPTTAMVTKKSKSAKQQGSDDITLPLMDKTQGQQIILCIPSLES